METDKKVIPITKQIIGIRIVQSSEIGVYKHESMYPIIYFFAILFIICWFIALIKFIGF